MTRYYRTVPKATLQRYPVYLKAIRKMKDDGHTRVLSHELADYTGIRSTTIRRDFSFIGNLGKQGYGYSIVKLIGIFENELGVNFDEEIILVGAGNLGKALMNYNKWNNVVGEIVCAFDIDPTNKDIGVPVYSMDKLAEKIPENCRIAIVAVSTQVQDTIDKLVDCGILGIVDFTYEHINVPEGVIVKSIDIVSKIQEIVFETNELEQLNRMKKQ